MSSDNEFEPTPPKHRRLIQPLMSSSNNTGIPVVRSLRSGRCIKLEGDNKDVYVLSDVESRASSQSGSASSVTQPNSDSPFTNTVDISVECEQLFKNSKRSSECRNNEEKDEAASSSNGIDSDSNDSQPEKCPICWLPFTNQEVATPSICDHRFCFHCLMEWSKTTNTCPVDRQTFNDINVPPKFGSKVTRLVPVETRVNTDDDIDVYEREIDSDDDDDLYVYDSEDGDDNPEFVAVNLSQTDWGSAYSTEEDVDDNSTCITVESSSSDENYLDENSSVGITSSSDENDFEENLDSPVVVSYSSDENDLEENLHSPVTVTSLSDEEVVFSSSDYNELSSSSSASSSEPLSSELSSFLRVFFA